MLVCGQSLLQLYVIYHLCTYLLFSRSKYIETLEVYWREAQKRGNEVCKTPTAPRTKRAMAESSSVYVIGITIDLFSLLCFLTIVYMHLSLKRRYLGNAAINPTRNYPPPPYPLPTIIFPAMGNFAGLAGWDFHRVC